MNRIDRLSAILIQLQSKRIVKAQEIAERFEISLRTVYRDVRALDEAGVPVVGEAGLVFKLFFHYLPYNLFFVTF
jgi:predicted DNA-binding transcriptional regulator YafY